MQTKMKNLKKIRLKKILIVFLFFCFFTPQKTNAAWIPGIDPIIRTGLQFLKDTIQGVLVGVLKKEAINTINIQIENLVGGTEGSEMFVTNWRDHLINRPKNKASLFLNDYLSQSTRSRNTNSSYSAEGCGGSKNYYNELSTNAKTKIEASNSVPEATYEGDPAQMFQNGNLKSMGVYLSGVNNPWSFNASTESAYNKRLEEEKDVAGKKIVANQGFNGTSADGETETYPGILTKERLANIEDIPNKTLASAQTIPEILTAMITQMLTKSVQSGFSSLQKRRNNSGTEVQPYAQRYMNQN